MTLDDLDQVLVPWASQHGIALFRTHRDEEVRAFELASPKGRRYQIWLEPSAGSEVMVNAWDFGMRKDARQIGIAALASALDDAYERVKEWMASEE